LNSIENRSHSFASGIPETSVSADARRLPKNPGIPRAADIIFIWDRQNRGAANRGSRRWLLGFVPSGLKRERRCISSRSQEWRVKRKSLHRGTAPTHYRSAPAARFVPASDRRGISA